MAIISDFQPEEKSNAQEIMQEEKAPSSEIMQEKIAPSSSNAGDNKPEKEESNRRVPNQGNGLDMEQYSWNQTLQEVGISIHVPQGTKGRDVSCEITKNHLKVGLKGQAPVIDADFFQSVKTGESYWTLENSKLITILLTKQDQKNWWKYLVKGDPEIDTQKVEPEPSSLSDLDPESRASIEKMMFDQNQKRMGLPTSEETQNQELMKQFMAQHPDVDFSRPAKRS